MLNKRKAQGLSITTIIIAVIALIVLVVIIAILTGRMGAFSSGVAGAASCENACKAFGKIEGGPATIPDGEREHKCPSGETHVPGEYEGKVGEMCCCKKAS